MGKKGEKHVSLTHQEKEKVHKWFKDAVPKPKQEEIVRWIKKEFGKDINRTTVSKMKLNLPVPSSFSDNPSFMRKASAKHPEHDQVMIEWVLRMEGKGYLTDDLVISQAEKVRDTLSIPIEDLRVSSGWLSRFKKRHNIRSWLRQGESGSLDEQQIEAALPVIREKLSSHQPSDVYNFDETGLFYKLIPSRALATKNIPGHKKDKSRITIGVCTNADGTDRLPLLVIGKSKMPRCFKGINLTNLGITYFNNTAAWMTALIFREWIADWDKKLRVRGRKILLLVDNMSGHSIDHLCLTHIEVMFLPPNTTSRLQPLDAGIIECFKRRYRKLFLRWRIDKMEKGEDSKKIDLLQVTRFLIEAYHNIDDSVIRNCWRTTKILPALDQQSTESVTECDLTQDIARLGLEDAMTDKEYVTISGEEQVIASDEISDIILSLQQSETPAHVSESEQPAVKYQEAVNGLMCFKTYVEQRDEDCTHEMDMIRKLIRAAECMSLRSKHQSKITDFFSAKTQ